MATAQMADKADFERIALPHLDAVYRAAIALGGFQRADDLTQVTFAKALDRFGLYRAGTNCKAWLMSILRNTWIDELRHRKVAGPFVPIEEQLVADTRDEETTTWSDAEDLLENFADQQVIEALRELPEAQRLALYLVDVERMSMEEAAEIMDVAVGTIKSRTSRARHTLKDKLQELADELGLTGKRSDPTG